MQVIFLFLFYYYSRLKTIFFKRWLEYNYIVLILDTVIPTFIRIYNNFTRAQLHFYNFINYSDFITLLFYITICITYMF